MVTTKTKRFPGGETTVSVLDDEIPGLYRVTVIHRFDSGNFVKEPDHNNLSRVAAEGLLALYTE